MAERGGIKIYPRLAFALCLMKDCSTAIKRVARPTVVPLPPGRVYTPQQFKSRQSSKQRPCRALPIGSEPSRTAAANGFWLLMLITWHETGKLSVQSINISAFIGFNPPLATNLCLCFQKRNIDIL